MKNKYYKTNSNAEIKFQDEVYYNFSALIFLGCYLLIDFLPNFKSLEIIGPQFLYISLLNIVIGIFIYKNQEFYLQNWKYILRENHLLKIYLLFISLCGLSVFNAGNVPTAIVNVFQILVIFATFINLFIVLNNRTYLIYKIIFLIGLFALAQSLVAIYGLLNSVKTSNLINELNNLKGNAGNINILAASINIKIPFILIGIIYFSKWKKWILSISLLLSTIVIFLINARAAILALILIGFVFTFFYFKINAIIKTSIQNSLFVFTPLICSFLIVTAIFQSNNGEGRYKSITSRAFQITDVNEATASVRISYWQNALKMIAKRPLIGIGLGNWKIECIPYENKLSDDNFSSGHTHNDFLEIAAETGIVNGIIYLSLFAYIFYINIRRLISQNNKNSKNIALLTVMLLLVYSVDAMFNFPLYRPTIQLFFSLLLVLTLINKQSSVEENISKYTKKVALTIIFISLISSFFTYQVFKSYQFEYAIKSPIKRPKTVEETKNNFPEFLTVGIFAEPFAEYLAIAYFNNENYVEARKYFNIAKKINPNFQTADWYIHKIEMKEGNLNAAYRIIKRVFYSRPRTLNYYLDAVKIASLKKDTAEIFKIHNLFTKYRSMPNNWKNTSSALSVSKYDITKLITFVDQGLKIYPNDTVLLNRKKKLLQRKKNIDSKSIPIEGLAAKSSLKINYMIEAKRMGDALQFSKAIRLYEKAYKENRTNKVILQDIAICYYQLTNYNTSIQYLNKVLNNPALNDGKTEYLLSGCYLKLNDKINGCKYLNIAFNKKYANTEQLLNQFCK